jgi:hypothetical protein
MARADLTDPALEPSGNRDVRLEHAEILTLDGEPTPVLPMGAGLLLRLRIRPAEDVSAAVVSAVITTAHGLSVCQLDSRETAGFDVDLTAGRPATIQCSIPRMNLMPGQYRLDLAVKRGCGKKYETLDAVQQAVSFEVTADDVYGTGLVPGRSTLVFLQPQWHADAGSVGNVNESGGESSQPEFDLCMAAT